MALKNVIFVFGLIGLVLGIILDQLVRHENITVFYYAIISLFCYLYVLSYNDQNRLRLIVTSFVVALFLSVPLIDMTFMNPLHDTTRWILFFAAFPAFVYVLHCFHYAYHHDNTFKVSYSTLFAAVWNTILILFVASIFSVIAHVLILLAAYIFYTLGYAYLWDFYFQSIHFRLICGLTLFFMGIGVGQQNLEVIYNLRILLLKMMYFLFPFLALISVLYFILFLTQSSSVKLEKINPITVLLPLVSLGILFFNAYFQDGTNNKEFPSWLKIFIRVYRVILFFLVLILIYKVSEQTSLNINTMNYLLVAFILSVVYAITALLPEAKEVYWIRIGNISAALFFAIVLFLTNLPHLAVYYTLDLHKSTQIVLNAFPPNN